MSTPYLMDIEENFLRPMTDQRLFDIEDSRRRIIELKKEGDRYLIAVGLELLWVKHHIGHGYWLAFLDEVEINPTTAQRYMKVANIFIKENRLERKQKTVSLILAFKELASNSSLTMNIDRELLWGNVRRDEERKVFLPVPKNLHTYPVSTVWRLIFRFLRHLGTAFIAGETVYIPRRNPYVRDLTLRILRVLLKETARLIEELEKLPEDEPPSLRDWEVKRDILFPAYRYSTNVRNYHCFICWKVHKGFRLEQDWQAIDLSDDRTRAKQLYCPDCWRKMAQG